MASDKQIAANRRNAQKSTGPKTPQGKLKSRCNALRHGLTAETVIDVFENAEDYHSFEEAILAHYAPVSIVARELTLRLASLLWSCAEQPSTQQTSPLRTKKKPEKKKNKKKRTITLSMRSGPTSMNF